MIYELMQCTSTLRQKLQLTFMRLIIRLQDSEVENFFKLRSGHHVLADWLIHLIGAVRDEDELALRTESPERLATLASVQTRYCRKGGVCEKGTSP